MAEIQRRELIKGAAAAAVGVAVGTSLTSGTSATADPAVRGHTPPPVATMPGGRDFPKVGGNLGNQNYTALDGIDHGNVRRLGAAWVNRIEGGLTTGNSQSTAVAVDGVLYIESALGNVFAVDGATGADQVGLPADPRHADPPRRRGRRRQGLHPRPAATGSSPWTRRPARSPGSGRSPGTATWRRSPSPTTTACCYCGTHDGDRGAGLALDAEQRRRRSGTSGARPGRASSATTPGRATPGRPAAPRRGSTRRVDPDLGLVYWTFGNARGNRSSQDGSARGGQNLFSSSIVAIDLRTGAVPVALPVHPPRHLGHGQRDGPGARRRPHPRPHAQARRLRQQVRHVLHPRPHATAPPRWASTSARCRRTPRQKTWPTQPFPRQGAVDRDHASWTSRWAPRSRATPTAPCPTTCGARSTTRTGTSRSCRSPATAAGPTGATSRSATAPGLRLHRLRLRRRGALADRVAATACGRRASTRPAASSRSTPSTNRVRWKQAHAVLAGARQRHPHHRQRPAVHRPARRQPARAGRPQRPRAVALPDRRRDQQQPDHVRGRRRAVPRRVRRRHRHPVRRLGSPRRLPVGVQDRRRRRPGAHPAAAGHPPSRLGRTGRGQRGRQHRRDRPDLRRRPPARSAPPSRPRSTPWHRPTCASRPARPSRSPTTPATPTSAA